MVTAISALLVMTQAGSMSPANYCAKSDLPDTQAAGGFAVAGSPSWTLADVNVKAEDLTLTVQKNVCCGTKGAECPQIVLLANGGKDPIWLPASDSRLQIGRESKDEAGVWRPIEFRVPSTCGNSRHRVALLPGRAWVWDVPTTTGPFTTECRYVLYGLAKPVTSKPFTANISVSMFQLPASWNGYTLGPDGTLGR